MSSKQKFFLRLYVAGRTPKSMMAIENLKAICDVNLKEHYKIEVVDLRENPRLARDHQIFALPTLVRISPEPVKQIIGDLSNRESVLAGLDIRAAAEAS